MAPQAPLTYLLSKLRCDPLYNSTNQQLLKRTPAIKVVTMKITDDFRYKRKPSHTYHNIDTFVVSKDEWETKEGTGKSMKNELHVQRYGKRHLLG